MTIDFDYTKCDGTTQKDGVKLEPTGRDINFAIGFKNQNTNDCSVSDVILLEKGAVVSDGSLTLTSTEQIKTKGCVKFADMTGYPEDFDINNYSSITVKLKMYDAEGQVIKEKSGLQQGKFCLNVSTNSKLYKDGYGSGLEEVYVHNRTPDSSTGEITYTFSKKLISDSDEPADCISAQFFSTSFKGWIEVCEVKFAPKE